MKLFKKIAGFILAFAMILAIAMPSVVMAADAKSTITIKGATAGSEYVAYKLFDATDDGNGHFSYTVNSKYEEALKDVTNKTSGAEIVKYLDSVKDNAATVREFADKVYAKVKNKVVDYTTTNGKFENIDQGYYLIAQTQIGTNEAYSLVMLGTAGKKTLTVKPKTGVPTFEKKIKEKNDSTGAETDWQDASDYDIGDAVPFKLTGTVSDKYASYKTYYYAFHDKMDKTLEFNANSVVVKIDGTVIDKSKYTLNTSTTDGCTFEVVFNDLKTVSSIKPKNVTVDYTATLKGTAKLGSEGNFNKGKLEFNNNPYYEGEGTYEAVNNDDPLKAPRLTKLEISDENGDSITGENKVFTTNLEKGTATTNIKNLPGSELPSTGGMGTTILYVAGAVMILAAGAFLVMQKKAEDK